MLEEHASAEAIQDARASPSQVKLGPWTLDVASGRLHSGADSHKLELKTARVLLLLAQHAGEVVSRDMFVDLVWDGRAVTDYALNRCIKDLRHCLGDTGEQRRYIETYPKRGYSLICDVEITGHADQAIAVEASRSGKRGLVIAGFFAVALLGVVAANYIRQLPTGANTPAIPAVSAYRQLTDAPILFPPTPSELPIVTDGIRLYFSDWQYGHLGLRQMSRNGGEAIPVDPDIGGRLVYSPNTMTPDGGHLVLTAFAPTASTASIWHLPVAGGTPRRVADGGLPRYSADGTQVVYAGGENGTELLLARADFSGPRTIARVPGRIHWPAFSPDGEEIRFHHYPPRHASIWRISTDGSGLRRLLPGWHDTHHCCGTWTPDGEYFVFEARRDNRSQLWAIREDDDTPEPVQITTGALDFIRPTIADGGRTLYAIGWQLRGEVVSRDPESGVFLPLQGLESLSAEGLSYSRDGRWVVYVSYPGGDLWRSTRTGEERLQLTRSPMEVAGASWSPDGSQIAFGGVAPGQAPRCYVVSADGGAPRPVTGRPAPGIRQWSPSWSPDGTAIAFSESGRERIQLSELATGQVTEIEGTEGLLGPQWSPDGRYIAAVSRGDLQLFDMETRQSESLVSGVPVSAYFWGPEGRWIYYVENFLLGPERAMRRISVPDRTTESVASLGRLRATFGITGFWFGITPEGEPTFLRDLSIHHLYALDWLPDRAVAH